LFQKYEFNTEILSFSTRSSVVAVVADRTACRIDKKLITAWFLSLTLC